MAATRIKRFTGGSIIPFTFSLFPFTFYLMADIPQLPLDKRPPPQPKPAFAGFMHRLFALLIDMVMIYFVGYTLELAAREPLLGLGPWLPWVSHLAAFTYFWLANGPVGGGTTIGKAIISLRTVGSDGKALTLVEALRRTVIQYSLVFTATAALTARLGGAGSVASYLIVEPFSVIAQALVIALAYGVMTHPHRRGWHDLWSGSFVTYDPEPVAFRAALAEPPDEDFNRRTASARSTSLVFFVMIVAMLGYFAFSVIGRADDRQRMADFDALAEDAAVPGYRLERVQLYDAAHWRSFVLLTFQDRLAERGGLLVPPLAESENAADGEAATQAPERTDAVDAPELSHESPEVPPDEKPAEDGILFFQYVAEGRAASLADAGSTFVPGRLEEIREIGLRRYETLTADSPTTLAAPSPTRFIAMFADRFEYVIFSPGGDGGNFGLRSVWYSAGPARPVDGPLEFHEIPAEQAPGGESTDRP